MEKIPLHLAPTEKRIARDRVIQQKRKLFDEAVDDLNAAIATRCERTVLVSLPAYLGSLAELVNAITRDIDPAVPG